MSPAEYRALAVRAFEMADEYRADAKTSSPERAARLLQWADQREEHAWFYLGRAEIDEDFVRRHPRKQEDNRHVA
ncbi:hypothetical protein CO670_15320 [Rhizobium sp. J15]|uniref:hypothetical protein n=1 Tax=Rhizobium sp. J15 TaxID=2035450 RepID=UPI000BEAD0DA|nr:hypothetical protein [Rhizobium sp. J15]PDT15865.1 hypothetical protein CO670_15320 [Rhizobium sp. J15]